MRMGVSSGLGGRPVTMLQKTHDLTVRMMLLLLPWVFLKRTGVGGGGVLCNDLVAGGSRLTSESGVYFRYDSKSIASRGSLHSNFAEHVCASLLFPSLLFEQDLKHRNLHTFNIVGVGEQVWSPSCPGQVYGQAHYIAVVISVVCG